MRGCNKRTGCQSVHAGLRNTQKQINLLISSSCIYNVWEIYTALIRFLELPVSMHPHPPRLSIWKATRRKPERAAARGPSAATPLFNRSLPPVETSTSFSPQVCRLISFYTCGDKIDSLLIPVFPLAVTSPAAEPVAARLTSVRRRKRCRGRPGTEGEGRGRRDPTGPQM